MPSNLAPPPSTSLKIKALPFAEVISLSVFLFRLVSVSPANVARLSATSPIPSSNSAFVSLNCALVTKPVSASSICFCKSSATLSIAS